MREDTLNLTIPKGSVERWTALQARREKLDETIKIERDSLKKVLRSTIERALSEVGITIDEVFDDKGAVTRMKGKSSPNRRRQLHGAGSGDRNVNPIKYQHPDDKSKKWTGRGVQPRWMKDLLASGVLLTSLTVSPNGE